MSSVKLARTGRLSPRSAALTALASLVLALGLLLPGAAIAGTTGSVSISLGRKYLSGDWHRASRQDELGLALAIGGDTWPMLIVLERHISVDIGLFDAEATDEVSLGVRRMWNPLESGRLHPYVSGGLAYISGGVGVGGGAYVYVEQDEAPGFFVDGGAQYELTRHFHLRAQFRYS